MKEKTRAAAAVPTFLLYNNNYFRCSTWLVPTRISNQNHRMKRGSFRKRGEHLVQNIQLRGGASSAEHSAKRGEHLEQNIQLRGGASSAEHSAKRGASKVQNILLRVGASSAEHSAMKGSI